MCLSIPNSLTFARIGFIPIILALFCIDVWWAVPLRGTLFVIACLTDYLDGYVARTYQQTSRLGRILDPLADKLLVILTLFMLTKEGRIPGFFVIPVLLMVAREIAIPGLREVVQEGSLLKVNLLAQWKTGAQMITLTLLVWTDGPGFLNALGLYGLWVAAFLTLLSGYVYLKNMPMHAFNTNMP